MSLTTSTTPPIVTSLAHVRSSQFVRMSGQFARMLLKNQKGDWFLFGAKTPAREVVELCLQAPELLDRMDVGSMPSEDVAGSDLNYIFTLGEAAELVLNTQDALRKAEEQKVGISDSQEDLFCYRVTAGSHRNSDHSPYVTYDVEQRRDLTGTLSRNVSSTLYLSGHTHRTWNHVKAGQLDDIREQALKGRMLASVVTEFPPNRSFQDLAGEIVDSLLEKAVP